MSTATRESVRDWVAERKDEILELLQGMIAIDSVTGNEGPMAEYCAEWLRSHEIETHLVPAKDRFNTIGVVGEGERTLVISGHLDTVPPNEGNWTYGPHNPTIADGKVFGLGSSDLHASIAAAYFASLYLKQHKLPGRFVTAFTIEEETTGDGTQLFLEWAEETGFLDFAQTECVVTEPTGLDHLCLGNRGSSFLVIKVKGLGGHGSRPHLARNPVWKVHEILGGIRELEASWRGKYTDPEFGDVTLTPTSINTGDIERTNVIPEMAQAVVDCRLTPLLWKDDLAPFRTEINACIDRFREEGYEIELEELYPREGHKLDQDHPLAQNTLGVLRDILDYEDAEFRYTPAGNDAVYFGMKGIPTVNKVGPGHPECAHRVDEFVRVENVLRGVELYTWIGLRHFGLV